MRGFTPRPDSRTFLPKSPRDPKKPNWVRFNLSNKDSKQGCRRQPCFWFSANCSYCFSDEGKKLKVRSTKIMQQNKTKQARPSSLLLLSIEAALTNFANRTSIVSINNAKVNSPNLSGLERSFWSCTRGHNQEKGWDTQGRERVFFFPPLCRSGECEGGYCRDSSPLTSFTCVRKANIKV